MTTLTAVTLTAVLIALVAIVACDREGTPTGVETAAPFDPLTGRIFSQALPEGTGRMEFRAPDYYLRTLDPEGAVLRTVHGIYEIYESPINRYRLRGTVMSVTDSGNVRELRNPFDVPILFGFEAITLDGRDLWLEVLQ